MPGCHRWLSGFIEATICVDGHLSSRRVVGLFSKKPSLLATLMMFHDAAGQLIYTSSAGKAR